MPNIREQVFSKSALFSTPNGRDYLKTPEGEIFSINGLYCDKDGKQDRWGSYVTVMDIRWTVVVWQNCWLGRDADFNPIEERRLIFSGDNKDEAVLAHYGYRMERDAEGYKNVYPLAKEVR